MQKFFCGLDLGQAADYSALVVAEQVAPAPKRAFHLRHIHRFRLGTPYPSIVNEVKGMTETAPLKGQCTLVIDRTGCGRPVFDLFSAAKLSCPLYGVSIHGGENTTCEGRHWKAPKRDLVGTIQALLQDSRLMIAKAHPEADTLTKELMNFRVKINPETAHEGYSAWREADHDDLVLATALACWMAEKQKPFQSATR